MLLRRLFSRVRIVEVGPRDGLQNEAAIIPTRTKVAFIRKLVEAGLETVEAASFVSPKWVPQMADAGSIVRDLPRELGALSLSNVHFPVLIPNAKGFESFVRHNEPSGSGFDEISVFTAASETFSRKNTNCSIEESFSRLEEVCKLARARSYRIRGYVSCIVKCPYEGRVKPEAVEGVARRLLDMGCYEISLGDTIGAGTPYEVELLLERLLKSIPAHLLSIHCHNTYGQALANIQTALKMGLRSIDSSCAGLGGCPYAPGASGNVATEDVVYMLQSGGAGRWDLGGIELGKIIEAGDYICSALGITTRSSVAVAMKHKGNNNK